MKNKIAKLLLVLILSAAAAMPAAAAAVKSNVMILLDTSGSMNGTVHVLPAYSNATSYPSVGYTATVVYQQAPDGSYVFYANNIAAVDTSAQDALTQNGFFFGTIGGPQYKLFVGNYLNYASCNSCKTDQTKISVAKRTLNALVRSITSSQFGVMNFINNNTQNPIPAGGGGMVAAIGTATGTIITAVNAITAVGWTPLGEQMRDGDSYYSGNFGFPSPISSRCQPNSMIVISDGQYNGNLDPRAQATISFTTDHSSVFASSQNVITHTIGFGLSKQDPAVVTLQQTAANGGGNFYTVDSSTQLEQALFIQPPALAINSPANNTQLSGSAVVSAALQNSQCVASVQFYLDGNPLGAADTSAPFSITWDTTLTANGFHTLTAQATDIDGNVVYAFPINVATFNDQSAPVINNVTLAVGITTATITWETNKAADTQVYYGLTSAYGQQTLLQDTNPKVTLHSVALSGLNPGTQYYIQLRSQGSTGLLGALSGLTFTTQSLPAAAGPLDHFQITFLNSVTGAIQIGPGTKSGNLPYALNVGECFSATIEAFDNVGNHSNFTGDINLGQYLLADSGLETGLVPGISRRSDSSRLDVSTIPLTMTNGFTFLGSVNDFTYQLCFVRASREPGDTKRSGEPGDMHLRVIETGNPAITGISDSYIATRGAPDHLVLAGPGQTLAPATSARVTGSLNVVSQGVPFQVRAYLTDFYSNLAAAGNDTVRFNSSQPAQTGFNPFSGALGAGTLISTVAAYACSVPTILTVDDLTAIGITAGSLSVTPINCGAQRFYEVEGPSSATAGATFSMKIIVRNVNIPAFANAELFSGKLVAVRKIDATHFDTASGVLSVIVFSFSIPPGTVGDFTYAIPNQTYLKSETIWLQLTAVDPADLADAVAMAGPIPVGPGTPTQIIYTVTDPTVGALSNTQITATLADPFGNGIAGKAVTIQLTGGSGGVGVNGTSLSQSLITDANGQVVFTFRSGKISENDSFTIFSPDFPSITPTKGDVLVSLLGNKTIAAYPNPVKITERPLTIEYRLEFNSDVTLVITDLFGREVYRTSASAGATGGTSGFNRMTWDGRNGNGTMVAVGVYGLHMTMTANGQTQKAKTRFGVSK